MKYFIIVILFFSFGLATDLQDIYNKSKPGNGYDKYIILNKDSLYTGGMIQDAERVYIQGNGAIINLKGEYIFASGENTILNIRNCVFISDSVAEKFLYFKDGARVEILNNTFYGQNSGSQSKTCIFFEDYTDTLTYNNENDHLGESIIQNNIIVGFTRAFFYYTIPFYPDIRIKIANNNLWGCKEEYMYMGGWTGFPKELIPIPGDGEINGDPDFVDQENYNFELKENSICIDAGIKKEIDYNGFSPDIGAIESQYQRFIGTEISDTIFYSFKKNKSPYIIIGNIIIPENAKIKIDQGVEIKFNYQKTINVLGELCINGSEDDSVSFIRNSRYSNYRSRIKFDKNASVHNVIKYANLGSVECYGDSITIENSSLKNIYCAPNTKSLIKSNTFDNNNSFTGTRAIFNDKNSNCQIIDNDFYCSSVYSDSSTVYLFKNRFHGQLYHIGQQYWLLNLFNNTVGHLESNLISNNFGGILSSKSKLECKNNLFVNCDEAFNTNNSESLFLNNTICSEGYGIRASGGSNVEVVNSILWTQGEYALPVQKFDSAKIVVSHSILSKDFDGDNISMDNPCFVDESRLDFKLLETSPAIDKGINHPKLSEFDYDNNKRIYNNIVDFGCYEFQGLSSTKNDGMKFNKYFFNHIYPNPFNPVATINFTIPEESKVKICVYNSIGQLIEKLCDCVLNSGEHNIVWEAKTFSSGLYYCKLDAFSTISQLSYSKTKKMILIK